MPEAMSPSRGLPDASRYAGGGSLNPYTQDEFKEMELGCQPGKCRRGQAIIFSNKVEGLNCTL